MPSLSPLSTLRPWRTRDGIRGSVTTAWPRAASVGASTIASRTASIEDELPEQADARERAGHDRERQPDREQPKGHDVLAAQDGEIDPRRIGEEHDDQRRLGDPADSVAPDRRVEPAEDLVARQDAAGDEHHRSGDRRAREPSRDGRIREDEEGERRRGPSRPSLSLPRAARERCSESPGGSSRSRLPAPVARQVDSAGSSSVRRGASRP